MFIAVIPAIVQLLLWRKDDVGGENVRTQSPESSASDCEDSGSRLSLCEKISLLLLTDLTLLTANHNNCRYFVFTVVVVNVVIIVIVGIVFILLLLLYLVMS